MQKSFDSTKVGWVQRSLHYGILPLLLYFVAFCLFTWPWITNFSTHFFCDGGDGLQNIWNLWWIDEAVTRLGIHPWFTPRLHHPFGISLLAHTLNAFNGFIYIPAIGVMTDVEAHNLVVTFSFVWGGWMAFLLCRRVGGTYWSSLIGGGIFTFSSYHFAHAVGHLQLVSLEWIPAFALAFLALLDKPSWRRALVAAGVLFLVILCDYYYFFYCVLLGGMLVLCKMRQERSWFLVLSPAYRMPLIVFTGAVIATSGILAGSLLLLSKRDPLHGSHSSTEFTLDVLALFFPTKFWRFSEYTQWLWGRWPQTGVEGVEFTVNLGLLGWGVVAWSLWHQWRSKARDQVLGTWLLVFGFFTVFCLGPQLKVWGQVLLPKYTPYWALERALPFLKMSGMPNRMVVMSGLALGVIVAIALPRLLKQWRLSPWFAVIFVAVTALEVFSAPLPQLQMRREPYADFLASQPDQLGVINLYHVSQVGMYQQRYFPQPLWGGYVSRITRSQADAEVDINESVVVRNDYQRLCEVYGFGYVIAPRDMRMERFGLNRVYEDGDIYVYKLGTPEKPCAAVIKTYQKGA